jgi:hypothetical protein
LANKSSFSNVIAFAKVKESQLDENGPFDFAIEQLNIHNNKPNRTFAY